jgi:hypothetical protein
MLPLHLSASVTCPVIVCLCWCHASSALASFVHLSLLSSHSWKHTHTVILRRLRLMEQLGLTAGSRMIDATMGTLPTRVALSIRTSLSRLPVGTLPNSS